MLARILSLYKCNICPIHANQFLGNAGFFSQVWQKYELSQHLVHSIIEQEAQLSPRDRAMRRVS